MRWRIATAAPPGGILAQTPTPFGGLGLDGRSGADGYLTVQGRPGACTLAGYHPGRGHFRYQGPENCGAGDVLVYHDGLLQDWADERFVCTDLAEVLAIVRYYREYGELHPAVAWYTG
ncbi:MAG TPA: hypothetical protein VIL46_01130 [Gemmataceae bacterium]